MGDSLTILHTYTHTSAWQVNKATSCVGRIMLDAPLNKAVPHAWIGHDVLASRGMLCTAPHAALDTQQGPACAVYADHISLTHLSPGGQ